MTANRSWGQVGQFADLLGLEFFARKYAVSQHFITIGPGW